MKIDASGAYNIPIKNRAEELAPKKTPEAAAGRKTDVAEFSHGSVAIEKNLAALKPNIMQDVGYSVPAERLAELQQNIKAGTYRVPTEAIVASILDS